MYKLLICEGQEEHFCRSQNCWGFGLCPSSGFLIVTIPCECGRSYIGETGRPLAVRLREHRHNLKQGLLDKSKLAQHAYEEGHKVGWDKARILEELPTSKIETYKTQSFEL
jgi:hypothetical protein